MSSQFYRSSDLFNVEMTMTLEIYVKNFTTYTPYIYEVCLLSWEHNDGVSFLTSYIQKKCWTIISMVIRLRFIRKLFSYWSCFHFTEKRNIKFSVFHINFKFFVEMKKIYLFTSTEHCRWNVILEIPNTVNNCCTLCIKISFHYRY